MSSFLQLLKVFWTGTGAAVAVFYYSWGLFFARWGQPHRAFWYMNRAVQFNPNNPKAFYHRGSLYMAVGQVQGAILDFSAAIKLDSLYVDAYTRRGFMYTMLDRDDEAQQDFDKAVQLGVDQADLTREVEGLRRER